MIKGIYLTADALQSKFKSIAVISNNLANINTAGYKRQEAFSEILKENGDKIVKQQTDFSQGVLTETGNTFDLAIKGDGFFTVKTENGTELTRKGNFTLDENGFLINEKGQRVLGKKGEINLLESKMDESNKINITQDGTIKMNEQEIDTLLISGKNKNSTMDRIDGLNFGQDEDSENISSDDYSIVQGYLEESNVNPLKEMEDMIQQSKEYETAYKVMGSLDQSLKQANEIGKI